MHASKQRGKPQLDASGNLILSKNDQLFTTTSSSAGPTVLRNASYVMLKPLGFWGKLEATRIAIGWIWSGCK